MVLYCRIGGISDTIPNTHQYDSGASKRFPFPSLLTTFRLSIP